MNKFKEFSFALLSVVALGSFGAWQPPEDYKAMTSRKRVCVSREIVVIGGVTNVVTHWQRDGKPDWVKPSVETNAVKNMKGKKQYNPLQADAEELREISKAAAKAEKKDSKTFEKACKDIEKARDKSSSEEFKIMYQKTLDIWRKKVSAN